MGPPLGGGYGRRRAEPGEMDIDEPQTAKEYIRSGLCVESAASGDEIVEARFGIREFAYESPSRTLYSVKVCLSHRTEGQVERGYLLEAP